MSPPIPRLQRWIIGVGCRSRLSSAVLCLQRTEWVWQKATPDFKGVYDHVISFHYSDSKKLGDPTFQRHLIFLTAGLMLSYAFNASKLNAASDAVSSFSTLRSFKSLEKQCFATFLPFGAPGSSFFWLFLFLLLLSSLTLPISAFHLSMLSEVRLLNWSCVFWSGCNGCSGHLVGHLTHNCWT